MSLHLDIKRIIVAIEQLEQTVPAHKLTVLHYLAMRNAGRWDLPSEDGDYDPLIKSIELFGVYAMAEEADELAKNWVKAAHNILMDDESEQARAEPVGPPELGTEVELRRSDTPPSN